MANQSLSERSHELVTGLRSGYATGRTKRLAWRKEQLAGLRRLLTEREDALVAALATDLGKSAIESYISEIGFVINEIDHLTRDLAKWLRPERAAVPLWMLPARARMIREPLGVVLVIAPWNYPLHLLLAPLAAALAAGNCAVVKPSELAPATAATIAELLPRYVDQRAVRVIQGGVPETTALLEQKFDHIFYTGNGAVGRIVMTAAAQHLTPVTLELGGKSPTVVDRTTDMAIAARRLAYAKFLNAGQTCVAPDYALAIGAGTADILAAELAEAVDEFYGPDPSTSADYSRIVNARHFDRLVSFLSDGKTVTGGVYDRSARYIAPTVLTDVSAHSAVMGEEIFGPILPILAMGDLDEAIAFINDRDKPLALYAFTEDPLTRRRLLTETSSGGLNFGLPMAHLMVPSLPFGGVGQSGTGAYHGKYSLDTFSHRKAVLDKPLRGPGPLDPIRVVYPPHTAIKRKLLRKLL